MAFKSNGLVQAIQGFNPDSLRSLEVWMSFRIIVSHKDKAINTEAHDLRVGGREECDICVQSTRRSRSTVISFVRV